jgi:putative transposase
MALSIVTPETNRRNRHSTRLAGHDYAQQGAYFITICCRDRIHLFGEIIDGKMILNECGLIAQNEWMQTPIVRPSIGLDEFVVMPNHIHGIIIVGATRRVAPTKTANGPAPGSIGAIIGQFKSITTKRINMDRHSSGESAWQRGFYDHIIRNAKSMNQIREYIASNPLKWDYDRENRGRKSLSCNVSEESAPWAI